jgi:DNA-binding NtrC family response regulator
MLRAAEPPLFVLVDADDRRRKRLERLAITLGAACRAAPAADRLAPSARVRVAVVIGAADAGTLAGLHRRFPAARLMVAGPDRSQGAAVAALRARADDFVCIDGDDAELAERIAHHLDAAHAPAAEPEPDACGLVGPSPAIAELRRFLRRVARSDATVLISGETGSGKECAALLLHRASARAAGPLVAVNCAAIPDPLLESELFGHARGAFSGAVRDHPGKMALADGGTLFLDEVGELSPAGQAKLLRAVETSEIHPVGARAARRLDIRIIAATNRDLAAETAAGRFREDLYWRLAVARVRVPPLRERLEDLPALAEHLLATSGRPGSRPPRLSAAAAHRLAAHDWPGNARELRNALQVAGIDAEDGAIEPHHLPLPRPSAAVPASPARERDELIEALRRCGENKAAAARALNCSRMTLYRRMSRHGLDAAPTEDVAAARPTCPTV